MLYPFRNILRLSVGDFLAKSLYFVAFVYLARKLGVESYGVLEFANATIMYFLFLADGGLELWGTREVARGAEMRQLVTQIVVLRLLLAILAFMVLLTILPVFPNYPALRPTLLLFGLSLFVQAANLKWTFMGQEQLSRVALGLIVAQVLFALTVFGFVRSPRAILWVPLFKLFGDVAMSAYFLYFFIGAHGNPQLNFTFRGVRGILRPALTMGAAHGIAIASYNFDSVLLGFMKGSAAVGLYNAAYKPVTAILAMPVTYFIGLFPALSRSYTRNNAEFREIVVRSLRLMTMLAVPIGVGGIFLAEPIINFLFGSAYIHSVPALQILSWSAVLVMLRGTYRQSLNAAGQQHLDLRCAGTAFAINVILNLLLIPRFGIIGAATATVISELIWVSLAIYLFHRHVASVSLIKPLMHPLLSVMAMGACFWLAQSLFWLMQALLGILVYFGVLLILGQTELRTRVQDEEPRFL
jgi:O-antigen/teichoic acid export membrane protein